MTQHRLAQPGDVVASRFVIDRIVHSGGMATVYRARDLESGAYVALKMVQPRGLGRQYALRLRAEAEVLSSLSHPAIVRYIAHGETAVGEPYLAIDWLDGEDLARYLRHSRLTQRETLRLAVRVADALSVAHKKGIVHRDIKPSNLVLVGSDPRAVVVVDFGVARQPLHKLTQTGSLVGTIGYMAPEQARREAEIGPGVDVFALGCVMFECLTGAPPFRAASPAAQIRRLLSEEAPSITTLCPGAPPALVELVARLLSKNPAGRPRGGAECRELLEPLVEQSQELPLTAPLPREVQAAKDEPRPVLVLRARLDQDGAQTQESGAPVEESHQDYLLRVRLSHLMGSTSLPLEDPALGTLTATLPSQGDVTELALRGLGCALAVQESHPQALIAMAIGLCPDADSPLLGELTERAQQMIEVASRTAEPLARQPPIWLDPATTGLLLGRFEIRAHESGLFYLQPPDEVPEENNYGSESGRGDGHAAEAPDATRARPAEPETPFVGRAHELQRLLGLLAESATSSAVRSLLIKSRPGFGKTRLVHELLQRIASGVTVLRAEARPGEGAFRLAARALRGLCGVADADPPSVVGTKLLARIRRSLPEGGNERTIDILCSLCGLRTREYVPGYSEEGEGDVDGERSGEGPPELSLQQAFVRFLRAECAVRPVLLVLDSFQWADAGTADLLDAALLELGDRPLTVLLLARSGHMDAPLLLGSGQRVQTLRLDGLTNEEGARLLRAVLGPKLTDGALARMLALAQGSPRCLEELLRSYSVEREAPATATLLALLQSNILQLPAVPRRVLQAASLFGETFRLAGILEVLRPALDVEECERALGLLVDEELVVAPSPRRSSSRRLYRFAHDVAARAAYLLMSETERRLGHLAALAFLLSDGEPDSNVLAEHARLGHASPDVLNLVMKAGDRGAGG